jgi:hypothetical protein
LDTNRYKEESHVKKEVETGVVLLQAKQHLSHQKLEKKGFLPKSFSGSSHLDFGVLPPEF